MRDVAAAVSSCKVFVPIYSPHYFDREFTGQEWHAFDRRLAEHETRTGRRPDAIVPVWWLPSRRGVPPVAASVQHGASLTATDHHQRGLRYLLQRKASRDDYIEILVSLADRILHVAEDPPAAMTFADLSKLPNAFERTGDNESPPVDPAGEPAGEPAAGPRHVNFLIAARGRDEMRVQREDLDVYGENWADWRPYYPGCTDRVAVRAQHEATAQDMTTSAEGVSEALFDALERAKERNELVVLLVDPWAVELPDYQALLRRLDDIRSTHTAVLVPWEPADVPPSVRGTALRDKLLAVLGGWADAGDHAFRGELGSIEAFVESLQQVLVALRARVVNRAEVSRRAAEAGPALRPSLAPFGG
jgi:FxsC-like protein